MDKLTSFVPHIVRRSARLFQSSRAGGVAGREAEGRSRVVSCARSFAQPVVTSASSESPRRSVVERVRELQRVGGQSWVPSLRAVSVRLVRCDSLLTPEVLARVMPDRLGKIVESSSATALVSAPAPASVTVSATASAPASVSASASANQVRSCETATQPPPPTLVQGKLGTGIRVLQLNMRRSAVVTGEVRQLVVEKRLDILLLQEMHVRKQDTSFAIVGLGQGMRVAAVSSQRPWAAVAVSNPQFQIMLISQLSTEHCACAEVRAPGFSFYVASCYFQYSDEIEGHLRHLEAVFHSLRGERLLIGMDANARSPMWGDRKVNDRGAKLEEFIRACGWKVLNAQGQSPTYWTSWGSSCIDVTLASPAMSHFFGSWTVRCDWTTSDHNALDIRLRVPRARGHDQRTVNSRFDVNRADWDKFAESLADLSVSRLEVLSLDSEADVESFAQTLSNVLVEASERAMPRKRRFRKSNPWWTKQLTILKKDVYRARRAYQRQSVEPLRAADRRTYLTLLRKYTREVRRTKRASWRKFVTEVGNSEPWGFVYKREARKLRVDEVLSSLRRDDDSSTVTLEETANRLLSVHVPDDREDQDTLRQREIRASAFIAPDSDDAPDFTEAEIVAVAKALKGRKAPGLDLVEVAVLKVATRVIPGQFSRLFNGCLQWGVFPSVWKRGSLRVFLKGEGKDVEDPKSYRPICLLSVVGKFFEKLLKRRLDCTSMAPGRISDRQFGFIAGKSTEDAIVELRRMVSASERRYVVALLFDISGAFDNVWWPLVLDAWRRLDCPRNVFQVLRSYFSDRKVCISFGDVHVSKDATRGCPQGSVLGPTCWTVMFDGLLRELENEVGRSFIAYADDLLVTVEGDSRVEIEKRGQHVVDIVKKWCDGAKLQISSRKTEAIALRSEPVRRAPIGRRGGARPDRKRKANWAKKTDLAARPPTIRLGNEKIAFRKTVRYLGIHFDKDMGVSSHCRYLSDKVGSLFSKLARLAGCRWGLRFSALSVIYRGVFAPTVAYAAAGWADLCTGADLRVLRTLQRRTLISATAAYRTASTESLCVAASAIPVDILLEEHAARHSVRKEMDVTIGNAVINFTGSVRETYGLVRCQAYKMWQARWSSSSKGRTTYAFFREVEDRVDARWVTPDHYVTQMITGHGKFQARLASLGLVEGEMCACGKARDTAAHHLLECAGFEPQRAALRDLVPVAEWRWPEAARYFVSTPEAYSVFAAFCRETLWLKGQV